jgi:hypothetical protein
MECTGERLLQNPIWCCYGRNWLVSAASLGVEVWVFIVPRGVDALTFKQSFVIVSPIRTLVFGRAGPMTGVVVAKLSKRYCPRLRSVKLKN